MEDVNAVLFDVTVYNISGTSNCEIALQGSNDLQNWVAIETSGGTPIKVDADAVGYYANNATSGAEVLATDVATAYVRLKYTMTSGTDAVISAGMNTFRE
jgi:hypothetical protein